MRAWRLSKSKGILLLALVALTAVCAVGLFRFGAALREKPLSPVSPLKEPHQVIDSEGALLRTIPHPSSTRDHLLDGRFRIVTTTEGIPKNCKSIFDSSFTNTPETAANQAEIELANPGQLFQMSDAEIPGVPFRRLVFAGFRAGSCIIYYQHGGTMFLAFVW